MSLTGSEEATAFFNSFAERFDSLYDEQRPGPMRWIDRRFRSDMFIRFQRTFDQFGDLNGKSVLDIGCGSGPYMLEAIIRGAHKVTGIDPAPNMLQLAQERLDSASYWGQYQLVEAVFPGPKIEPHDFIIVMGVMDYVHDAQEFLSAMRPIVRRQAALSFPSRHWYRSPFRKFRYRIRNCPVYFYDESKIRAIMEMAQFDIASLHKIPGAGMDYHVVCE